MKSLKGKVIVKIEQAYDDKIGNIYIDKDFNPTNHARIHGEVVSDSQGDIQKGDKIYFHYNVVEDSHIEKDLYNVEMDRVFCAVRDGKIVMINDWCFVEPIEEQGEFIEVDGRKIHANVKGGLVVSTGRKNKADKAKIKHIPENDLGLHGDDDVFLLPDWEFFNEIEGEKYATVRLDHIVAKA